MELKSPTLPPSCITAEGYGSKLQQGGRIEKRSTRVQPEATANTKHLFFLDVGQMLAASRDHSVPHGKLEAYKSYT